MYQGAIVKFFPKMGARPKEEIEVIYNLFPNEELKKNRTPISRLFE